MSTTPPLVPPTVPPMVPPFEQQLPIPPVQVVIPPRLGKLLNKPSEYDGRDRAKCNTFISQLKLYIGGNPEVFPNEASKVLFAATYLRDRAFTWFEPRMNNPEDPILSNFQAFCEAMLESLGDPELRKTMMRRIKNLRQTGSCANYRTEFENHAQYLNIGDIALKEYFYDGLKDNIKDIIATAPADQEPANFESYKAWCVRIDSRLHDRKQDGGGNKGDVKKTVLKVTQETRPFNRSYKPFNRSFGGHNRFPQITRNSAPEPMDLDASVNKRFKPLSKQERQRRYDNNLCLYCGKEGHRATHCPVKDALGITNKFQKMRIQATLVGPENQHTNEGRKNQENKEKKSENF